MKRFLLASLVLLPMCAAAQDTAGGDVPKLIAELSADDASVRERAAARLYELRKTSEAPLRAHRTDDATLKARIAWVLNRIEERRLLDSEMALEKVIELPGGFSRALAGSPADGKFATSAPCGGVGIWEANPLRYTGFIDTGDRVVTALAFDPEGKWLLVAAGAVGTWDARSGVREREISKDPSPAVAWSADGESVAYVSAAGEVVVADPGTGTAKGRVNLAKERVRCLAAAVDATLVAGCEDGSLVTISFETGKETARASAGGKIRALALMPDGLPVVGLADGKIRWGKIEQSILTPIRSLATDHNGKRVVAGMDFGLLVWDSDGVPIPHNAPNNKRGESLVAIIHPKLGRLIALDIDGTVAAWRAPDQPAAAVHWGRFRDLQWTRDCKSIAAWGVDLVFADVASGKAKFVRDFTPLNSGPPGTNGFQGAGPDEILITSNEGAKVWSASKAEPVRGYSTEKDEAGLHPEWTSPDGAFRIATEGRDGVWLRPVHAGGGGGGSALSRANRYLLGASWSPDSKHVGTSVAFDDNGRRKVGTLLFDSAGKRLFEDVEDGYAGSVALDPGDRWIVWTVDDKTWRVPNGDLRREAISDLPVVWFRFLDARAGLGINGAEVTLWFTPDFRIARTWNLGPFNAWELSPDGKRLALLRPGGIRIYRIDR
ncbi:MAG: Pyrrolo-quinoline [Planctomycetota bacterium]|nr:MAG: Pyrrolo-quinoline [Planctomycetota bacterium]